MGRFPHLVEASRGHADRYESRHAGVISVVDGDGKEIASAGDTDIAFPMRSTAKPFQLLPFVLDGVHCCPLGDPEQAAADLALMMSSHAGEPVHTARVAAILEANGMDAESLQCGAHWPYHAESRDALLRARRKPTALHSNCSGKHAAMLVVCKRRGWPLDKYTNVDHPIQRRIRDIVASLMGETAASLPVSIDGCSLPTYWASTRSVARMYAALAYPANAPKVEDRDARDLLGMLFTAGTKHPDMIGGTGRFDTRLMQAFSGRLFAKSGAAGMYAMALAPCAPYPSGLGIGFKIEDGDFENRVRPVVACEILKQLGIDLPDAEVMAALANATIRNVRDLVVGEYRSVFRLS